MYRPCALFLLNKRIHHNIKTGQILISVYFLTLHSEIVAVVEVDFEHEEKPPMGSLKGSWEQVRNRWIYLAKHSARSFCACYHS